jgi:hypothetical protein
MKPRLNYLYKDPRYGFTVRIPDWWRPYTVIDRTRSGGETEYDVRFLFKYRGKTYGDVLTISVFKMSRQEWIRQGYDSAPFILIGERNGRLFAYSTPGELPDEFLKKDKSDYDYVKFGRPIRFMKRMVNDDVPKIIGTFHLPGLKPAAPAPYLAKGVAGIMAGCGCRKRITRRRIKRAK